MITTQYEQLSIFDTVNFFQSDRANWVMPDWAGSYGDTYLNCEVLAYVPDEALSGLEQLFREGSMRENESLRKYRHKLWSAHTWAIWSYMQRHENSKADWTDAYKRLAEKRDAKEAVGMVISKYNQHYFEITQVVKYLDREGE